MAQTQQKRQSYRSRDMGRLGPEHFGYRSSRLLPVLGLLLLLAGACTQSNNGKKSPAPQTTPATVAGISTATAIPALTFTPIGSPGATDTATATATGTASGGSPTATVSSAAVLTGTTSASPSASASTGSSATATPPAASAASGRTYTVQAGDTLAKIAGRYGVSTQDLISTNIDIDPDTIRPGQGLKLPLSASTAPSTSMATATVRVTASPSATAAAVAGARAASSTPPSTARATGTVSATAAATAVITAARSVTATPIATPASASSGAGQIYTVQAGDTACKIALRYQVSLEDLASANGTSTSGLVQLKPGQDLRIPSTSGTPQSC
ncbi:MAG: LysM peptidoglycan-binding domain-containing protein [Dehalococcoidia bacterium]